MYTFIHRTIAPVGKCAWQLHYISLGTVCPYFLCTFLPCSFIVFWTNLGDSDEDIIALYHAHGEC